jgi:predicted metalloprotease with PDZ domain
MIELISGVNLSDFWRKYLFGTEELDYDNYLNPFGLMLQSHASRSVGYTGLSFRTQSGTLLVKAVDVYSPAQRAGISANDELIAVNGTRVTIDSIYDRLGEYAVGSEIELTFFHQDELRSVAVKLAPPINDRYVITAMPNLTTHQTQRLNQWLGQRASSSFA